MSSYEPWQSSRNCRPWLPCTSTLGYARRHPKRKQVLLDLMKATTGVQIEASVHTWYVDFALDSE